MAPNGIETSLNPSGILYCFLVFGPSGLKKDVCVFVLVCVCGGGGGGGWEGGIGQVRVTENSFDIAETDMIINHAKMLTSALHAQLTFNYESLEQLNDRNLWQNTMYFHEQIYDR